MYVSDDVKIWGCGTMICCTNMNLLEADAISLLGEQRELVESYWKWECPSDFAIEVAFRE